MASIRERVRAFLKPETRSTNQSLKGSFTTMMGASESGITVNEETAQKFSAVWLAIRLYSELPASLGIDFFEEKNGTRTPIEHEAKELLLHPNTLMNRFTYHETMNAWLQGWGNGISIITAPRGRGESLIPIHPSNVELKLTDGKLFYKIDDKDLGIRQTFFADEIVHYRGFTTTGYWGKSTIQQAKDNIGMSLAAEKFGANFYKKGGNLKAVIETPGHLPDAAFKEWKKRWQANYEGDAGNYATPVLEHGMTYKALGIPPHDAEFIETRQFGIQDVARWFNLPPHMLKDLSRATFSNIEHQDLEFVKYSLRPVLRRQEIELEEKLLQPKERGIIKIRYNIDGLLRGDLASITQHIKEMVLSGVMSPDEGRALLNRNPRPGGDKFYIPANIVGNNIQNNATQ